MRRCTKHLIAGLILLGFVWPTLLRSQYPGAVINRWTRAADMAVPRAAACAAILPDGRVLVVGGSNSSGVLNTAELYGLDGAFTPVAPMAQARTGAACVAMQDGRVLVTGGSDGASALASAEIYDPALNTWKSAGSMAAARAGHTAALMPWGSVLIVGGDSNGSLTGSVEQYDVLHGKFLTVGALSSPRQGSAIAILPNHQVIIAGGSDGSSVLATVDLYDPGRGAIVPAGTMLTARTNLAAASLLDGTVLITGGSDAAGNVLLSAEIFDPVKGVSAMAPDMSEARADHWAYTLPNDGRVLLLGGANGAGTVSSTDSYAPQTGTFTETSPMNVARSSGATSLLSRGAFIVAGGQSAYGYLAGSEVYSFATVETDKSDYPPGTPVTMTGSGWKPGETVLLQVTAYPMDQHRIEFTGAALADGTGQIRLTGFQVDQSHLGVKFLLSAAGSESQAETLFSDGFTTTTTVSPSAAEQPFGTPVTFTATVTNTSSSATPTGTVTFIDTDANNGTVTTLGGGPIGFFSSSGNTAQAHVTVSNLWAYWGPNTHTIHATYIPADSTFTASSSTTDASYTVDPIDPVISISATHVPNNGAPVAVGETIGMTATFATVAGVTPTGVSPTGGVDFFVNGIQVDNGAASPVTMTNGSAYFPYSGPLLVQPSVQIGVNYLGDPNYNGQLYFTNQITQPVAAALTTTTVSSTAGSSPATITYGTPVTYTATIAKTVSGTIGGNVTFQDNSATIACSGGNPAAVGSGGVAQCVPSPLPAVGAHAITAVYSGDANFSGSTSAAYNLQVNAEPTTTTLAQPADSTLNGTIPYVATVTGSPVTPTGTVDFKDVTGSSIILCSGVSVVGGTCTCPVTYNGVDVAHQPGAHSVQAFFNSNDATKFANSTSSAVTVNVSKGNVTLGTVVSSQGASYVNGNLTNLTVTLTPGAPTPAYTGTVQFLDGSTILGTATLTPGLATLNSVSLGLGSHTITAQFVGPDPNYSASSPSPSLTIIVSATAKIAVTLGTIGSSQGASYIYGPATNLTVALNPGNNPAPAYTGMVQFLDGSTILGTVAPTSSGSTTTAALNGVVLGGGSHTIVAQFLGDSNYGASAPSVLGITVTQFTPTLTNTGAPGPFTATYGGQITVGPIGVSRPPGAAYPTSTVTLTAGPGLVQVGSPGTLSGTGTVTFTNAQLPATLGPGVGLNLVVTYNGDSNYNSAALIPNLSLTVTKATPAGALITSGTPSDYNTSVTLTLTLGPQSGNVGMPTGTVNFYADGNYTTPLNSTPVTVTSGGVASFSYSGLAPGAHTIAATYSGDTDFNAVVSASPFNLPGGQTVRPVNTVTTVTPSATNTTLNTTVTYTVTVQGGPIAMPPQGSVEVDDGGPGNAVCTISASGLVNGEGSCTVTYDGASTPLAAHSGGTHSITASYTSTDHTRWLDSTSTPVIVTVAKTSATLGTIGSSQGASYAYGTLTNLTVTLTPGNPTPAYRGTVQFFDGATPIPGTVTLTSAGSTTTATLSGAFLSRAQHTVTAQLGGDPNYNASSPSPALTITVNKASSNPTATTTSYTVTYGGTLTTSAITVPAAGSGTAPTGTLTLTVGPSQIGNPGTLSSGSFTFTNAQLPASLNAATGAQTLLVTYSGDTNYNSTTLSLNLTVSKAAPAGTLTSNGASPPTFTLTLGPPAGNAGVPSGTVNFYVDGVLQNVTPVPVSGAGVASYTLASSLTPGSHTITAVYGGDTNYATSTILGSASLQTITFGALSDKTLGDGPFVVTASASSGLPVSFTSTTPSVCTVSGVTVTLVGAGTCSITASQAGNASYGAATPVTQSFRVTLAYTPPTASMEISSSQNSSLLGQSVTFTVTITYTGPVPTGTIQLFDGTKPLGTAPLVNGRASFTVTFVDPGSHGIVAIYSGDGTYASALEDYAQYVIKLSSGTMTLTSSLSAATFGQAVTFTARLLTQPPAGIAPPSGQVQFFDGTTLIGVGSISSSGAATLTVTNLAVGVHQITATYAGDNNWNPGNSVPLTQIINKALTATAFTPSVSASNLANVIMTATVVVLVPGAGTPTGAVQLVDATTNTVLASAPLAGGIATAAIPLNLLNLTNDLLIAGYVGDSDFVGSSSAPLAQVVAVNAASYTSIVFAPDEIVTVFGTGLANTILWGAAGSQANSLAGLTLGITDTAGVSRQAHLFYVSPTQVNFLLPSDVASGPAIVTAVAASSATFSTFVTIARTAPGLFTANSGGMGIAAGQFIIVHSDGTQTAPVPLAQQNSTGQWVPVPISAAATDQVFLVLYGTGIRYRPSGTSVTAMVNGQSVAVAYAGSQAQFAGEDQVNLGPLPSFAGAGMVNVQITVNGEPSNIVTVAFQ